MPTGAVSVGQDILFVSALTHLHMRGKSVKVFQTTPDGKTSTLLSIPNYYYGWQTGASIRPKNPMLITKGSKLSAECRYDNSSQNPHNPDPGKMVSFGQRIDTTEMCSFSIVYYDK